MRHVVIYKRTADLTRLDLREREVASFYVGDDGIERVEFGEDEIPRSLAVFDPAIDANIDRITLEDEPVRWAELLPTAYRSGDYRVAVAKVASADSEDELRRTGGITKELEAIPH